ncbi:hypothetical protein [Sphingobacterium sp. UGAL515B_05]|nr:hypothetical protein [Sphingobacterium sp. UGAL515B_05]WON94787.1 hypothetical protein OK025_26575 [Sphingobacterium sp. UGAL515B_05]
MPNNLLGINFSDINPNRKLNKYQPAQFFQRSRGPWQAYNLSVVRHV